LWVLWSAPLLDSRHHFWKPHEDLSLSNNEYEEVQFSHFEKSKWRIYTKNADGGRLRPTDGDACWLMTRLRSKEKWKVKKLSEDSGSLNEKNQHHFRKLEQVRVKREDERAIGEKPRQMLICWDSGLCQNGWRFLIFLIFWFLTMIPSCCKVGETFWKMNSA
jgi:hypothetical protein